MIRFTRSILHRPIVYCHFKALTVPHRFSSIRTDIDESQKSIIDSLAIDEVQRSQLVSLAKYLNLPWDNLVEFTAVVKAHEKEFKMRLEKEFNEANDEAITEYYLQNVFHIFSHSITESPDDLVTQIRPSAIGKKAFELIRQKKWDSLKDKFGDPISVQNSAKFLEELATRILNLEYLIPCVMPDRKRGHESKEGDFSLFIQSLPIETMTFTSIPPEDCTDTKYELLYYHLKPTTVFAAHYTTHAFSKNIFTTPKKEADITDSSLSHILNYVIYRVFNESVLPNMNGGSGFELYRENQPISRLVMAHSHNSRFELSDSFSQHSTSLSEQSPTGDDASTKEQVALQKFSSFFNQRLKPIHGKADLAIRLKKKKHETTDKIFESDHKLAIFELKHESKLGDLAMEYFPRDSKRVITLPLPSEKLKANYKNDRKSNKAKNQGLAKNDDDLTNEEKRLSSFITQSISYCKLEGTTMNIISNGDDFILLFADKFYEKIENFDPKHDKINDEWRISIVKRNEFPILTVLSCVFLSEYKKFIDHRQLTNTEVVNWFQTYGSGENKKVGDKTKFLINRKVFYKLMSKRIRFPGETRELFDFKWNANEVSSLLKVKITQSIFNKFIKGTVEDIKSSYVWKQYAKHKKNHIFPRMKFDLLKSEDFQIIEVLQNEVIGKHASATTFRASMGTQLNGILKIFDSMRMPTYDKFYVAFKNGYTLKQTFRNLLILSYKMFYTEYLAYSVLGSKDYLPKMLHCGVLYIPKLSASIPNGVDEIYESPFYSEVERQNVKTESLFIYLESIKNEKLDQNVDFGKLLEDAQRDLDEIHSAGVIHRDLSHRNIIIKKSKETDSGYRVVFIDFGLSLVSNLRKAKEPIEINKEKTNYTDSQVKQMSDEQIDAFDGELKVNIIEQLKKIDRKDLTEAIRYHDPGK